MGVFRCTATRTMGSTAAKVEKGLSVQVQCFYKPQLKDIQSALERQFGIKPSNEHFITSFEIVEIK